MAHNVKICALATVLAGQSLGSPLAAQQPTPQSIPFEVSGQVVAIPEQLPLRDVPLTILELKLSTSTDSAGNFAFKGNAAPGCYHLRVAAPHRQITYWRLHFQGTSASVSFEPLPLFAVASPPDSVMIGICAPGDKREVMR